MNLNVKLDGEEEQPLQYVNRFAINIPPGAINLNIVNPALGNQSYILNPMNSVGQNIVAYQPSMALQSYIALPTEAEGNIIHGLPVGVPVPVGLPVSTGLLQNNFVNTSIIIGDEDCNAPGVIKSTSNNLNPENEIKINYIEKPLEKMPCTKANGIEVQSIGVNCSPPLSTESVVKKLCPLEMSIKAANIDIEFEKCEPEVPILLDNCQGLVGKQPLLVETVPLAGELKEDIIKVPLEVPVIQSPIVDVAKNECKKTKTEITWENNNKQELLDNGFQESLICEVEEEDEDEEDDEEGEEEEEEEEDEEEEEMEKEKDGNKKNCESGKLGVNSGEGLSSSEESDSLPLSVALKLNKLPNSKSSHRKRGKRKSNERSMSNDSLIVEDKTRKKKSQRNKKQTTEEEEEAEGADEEAEDEEEDEDWMKNEDDVLNLKRIKNEFNYKCFYEPNPAKSTTSLVLKIDEKSKKFVRVRSCCSKRECGKKISVQDQKSAHKNFNDLESTAKRDAYLMNCIEHVQKARSLENAKDKTDEKLLEKTKIQLEIENESNGNQKLSDEIQKAINESLKDCAAAHEEGNKRDEGKPVDCEEGNERKNSWNFYIVIDRCRKKVCLQFLLKLFQIPKSRIKNLQKKILSGAPLADDSARGNQKSDIWEVAKSHLDGLDALECTDCNANPRHRFFTEQRTREDLFDSFKDFYCNKLGKAPNIKYASYKRFLDKKTSISFCINQEGICTECEELKKHKKRKQSKSEKSLNKGKKTRECKKQWVVKTDSEENSSDDEPLLKRKKLKLTIPLKAVSKPQQSGNKRNSKKYSVDNKSKGKSKQSGSRGRDVWSLMLLHLETMPFKECKSCVSKKRHRFLDSTFTTQGLFEDYRKYFLKETNSELGLGFTMYEKYFNRNCNYTISDVDVNAPNCPRCVLDGSKS